MTGALAVAVPGEAAGLAEAQKRFGTLPLHVVMAPINTQLGSKIIAPETGIVLKSTG